MMMAPREHMSGGRGRAGWSRWPRGRAGPCLHDVLQLGRRKRGQLTSIRIHLAPAATAATVTSSQWGMSSSLHSCRNERGSPLRQEGFRGLGRGYSASCGLEAAVGSIGQSSIALQGGHVASGTCWVLRQAQVTQLALPAAHIEGVGCQMEGRRRAGRREKVCRAGGGWSTSAGGSGRGASAPSWKTESANIQKHPNPKDTVWRRMFLRIKTRGEETEPALKTHALSNNHTESVSLISSCGPRAVTVAPWGKHFIWLQEKLVQTWQQVPRINP